MDEYTRTDYPEPPKQRPPKRPPLEKKPEVQTSATEKRPPRRPKKKKRVQNILLNLLIVGLIVAGAYLLLRPRIMNYYQDKKTDNVLAEMETSNDPVYTIVLGPNDYKVEGEELEDLGYGDEVEIAEAEISPDPVQVNMYATINIPKIDLVMPVADEATLHSLRVSVGHWSPSAKLGEKGNAVVFGHRMYVYGRHFHRLHEMEPGDTIQFTTYDAVHVYEVDEQRVITPEQLYDTITAENEEAGIILVTCTPLTNPRGTHRLLIFGHLVETRPIER